MGGFSNVLGHVATGFEQARQIDAQRQFEEQQALRQQHLQLLGKLASDETLHPDLRNWAMQEGLNGLQQQPGKKWQPNWKSMPAPPTGGGQQIAQPTQSFTPNPMPTPPPSLGATGPAVPTAPGAGTATFTPPPVPEYYPGTFIKTHEALAQEAGRGAGAVAGGQLSGQIAARQAALSGMPIPPEESAVLAVGAPLMSLARTMGTGGGFAKDLRAQGHNVPASIPDDQWVNVRETAGLGNTYVPAAPPSGQYTVNAEGKPEPKYQAQIDKEQRELAIWHQKNKVQFGQALIKQNVGLQNALVKNDYDAAKKIVNTSQTDLQSALDRMSTMDQNLVAAKQGDQQAMLSLVANHIGMTLGAQKGARITRAVWDEAMQSAPWMQRVAARFDKNGLLMGVTLSPQQMDQMVALGHEKVGVMQDHVTRVNELYQQDLAAKATKGMPKPPAGGTQPPKPPGGMVMMKAPNGMTKSVPADQVEHYKSRGATVVQ